MITTIIWLVSLDKCRTKAKANEPREQEGQTVGVTILRLGVNIPSYTTE
jgi:hypothetical protein